MSGVQESAEQTVVARLDRAAADYRLHWHEPVMRAEDHANSGLPLDSAAKTLAFRVDDEGLALVLLPASAKLAYGVLARALGTSRSRLKPASPADLSDLGMQPGGVCPFVDPGEATVVIDDGVLELPVIYCGSGTPRATVEITPEQLRRACPDALTMAITPAAAQ